MTVDFTSVPARISPGSLSPSTSVSPWNQWLPTTRLPLPPSTAKWRKCCARQSRIFTSLALAFSAIDTRSCDRSPLSSEVKLHRSIIIPWQPSPIEVMPRFLGRVMWQSRRWKSEPDGGSRMALAMPLHCTSTSSSTIFDSEEKPAKSSTYLNRVKV